jgi:uncharacterized protein YqfA (UPF0365 family)
VLLQVQVLVVAAVSLVVAAVLVGERRLDPGLLLLWGSASVAGHPVDVGLLVGSSIRSAASRTFPDSKGGLNPSIRCSC